MIASTSGGWDVLRGAAIVLGLTALALFPGTVVHRIRGWRSGLVGTIVALLFGSLIASTWAHLGYATVKWYRSPVLLLASILALVYVVSVRGWHVWTDRDVGHREDRRRRHCRAHDAHRRKDDWHHPS